MTDVGSFLKSAIVEEKRSPGNEVQKVHYLNEMATSLPNLLYAKIASALFNQPQRKTKLASKWKGKKVKGFFIFMTMLSFKQIKSNYGRKEPCEQACCWIIKFSHCLNFGYHKYGIIIFFHFKLEMAVHATLTKKKICEVNKL